MRRIIRFFFRLIIILLLLSVGSVVLYRYVPVPITPLMVRNAIGDAIEGKPIRIRHDWVPLTEMSPHLKSAVIASEDQRFYSHDGFDWKEISNAIEERRAGKRKRGGSTISQQTAKNVYTFCTSTWARKGIETYYTLLIEWIWPKERILEVYLNSIEMGEGLYGVAAVAKANFKKIPAKLTRKECALIAATLPNPRKLSSKKPTKYIRKRQAAIIKNMKYIEKIKLHKENK